MEFLHMEKPIPGIPTVYRGIQFRSRLEARWAAFFDLLRWPYQYEPFDLEGWIPDFLIMGESNVLVEVKPVVELPRDVAAHVMRRVDFSRFEALILGCVCPIADCVTPYNPGLGWLCEGDWGWNLGWQEAAFCRTGSPSRFGFMHATGYYGCRITGVHEQDPGTGWDCDIEPDEIRDLWNRAGNLVQWRGKQSVTG